MAQDQIKIKTPEFVSLQYQLAGLGSRAAASIIDYIILILTSIVVIISLLFMTSSDMFFFMGDAWVVAIAVIGLFVLQWGYFVVCEYFFGGKTIGKNMFGIRVIQENGHSMTFLSALIRNLLRIIDMLPASYFLGIVLVFFHSRHKRIGDMAAGTIVVHERQTKWQKQTPLEREIERRGLSKDSFTIEDSAASPLGAKEYQLLKTYSYKLIELRDIQRDRLTEEMAAILFPKVGLNLRGKTNVELENILLVLYLKMREDWEFLL